MAALNDNAKAVTDIGITGVLHQHTGTCVETQEEVYSVLEAVDTRYVKFGPDVGQLAEGWIRSGEDRGRLPIADPACAPEGLRWRRGIW